MKPAPPVKNWSAANDPTAPPPQLIRIAVVALETVTLAVPLFPPAWAVTVNGPPGVLPAVKVPMPPSEPPPLTVQANVGWVAIVQANLTLAVSVNFYLPLRPTV